MKPRESKSRKRLLLHIGLQKTGTTSLQALLQENKSALGRCAVYSYGADTQNLRDAIRKWISNPTKVNESAIQYIFGGYCLRFLKHSQGTIIFSDENILGRVLYDKSGDLITWAEHILPRLIQMVPDEIDLEIVVYVRDSNRWLKSAYRQAVKRAKESRSFETWTRQLPFSTNMSDITREIESICCGVQCHVIEMENDLKINGFVGGELLKLAGFQQSTLDELSVPKPRNQSLSWPAHVFMRIVNFLPLPDGVRMPISETIETLDSRVRA